MAAKSFEDIVNIAKRRGFVFNSSEIYGGLGSAYDYGPLGVLLKNNIRDLWWKEMVQKRDDIVGLDAAILMSPKVWEASGHVENFTDPLVECKKCHERFRADDLPVTKCSKGGQHEFTQPKTFNLLMKTYLGPVEDSNAQVFLRGETCQGIYVNFKNILQSSRVKVPFGIAQIGKAFRNEITPGNFIFRMREFEQMEMQFFVKEADASKFFEIWKEARMAWRKSLGINPDKLRFKDHGPDELAHYAKQAVDIEYEFPIGWKELEGIHNRGDWDLSRHQKFSGKDLSYFDEETKERFIPWIIETSAGLDRSFLAVLADAYEEIGESDESGREKGEIVLHLDPKVAPYKAAIFPLVKKEELTSVAKKVFEDLKKDYMVFYDETGSIGRRYRRQDEIGTPYCITIDFDSLEDNSVTIRDRDSLKQERIKIDKINQFVDSKLA